MSGPGSYGYSDPFKRARAFINKRSNQAFSVNPTPNQLYKQYGISPWSFRKYRPSFPTHYNKPMSVTQRLNRARQRKEIKYLDGTRAIAEDALNTNVESIASKVIKGTDRDNRIGEKITPISNIFNFRLTKSTTDTSTGGIVRLICVQNIDNRAESTDYQDVYDSDSVMALRLKHYPNRKVIYHKTFAVDWTRDTGGVKYLKAFIKFKNNVLYNDGTSSTDTDIDSGSINWIYVMEGFVGATKCPAVYMKWRLNYYD